MDFFRHLFDYSDFNPRNTCGAGWNDGLLWAHVVSDCLIWFSYLAIPCVLVYFVRKRRDSPFPHLFWLFGAFILSCGTTHLVAMFMFSYPMYRLDALIKIITATVSLGTVVALIPATPKFLAMRSPSELEAEIAERKLVEAALKQSRIELEQRVQDRTAELNEANKHLQNEIAKHQAMGKALQEAQARQAAILESALDCIITIDRESKIVEFNPAAEKVFGYRRAEVLGQHLAQVIIPPALRDRHTQGLARFFATGSSSILGRRLELPAMRADGTEFLSEISISIVHWDGPPLFTGFLRDITERKRAEERFRIAVEAAPNGMLMVNADGKMVLVNQVAAKMFGYRREELTGQPLDVLVPSRFRDQHPTHRNAFFNSPEPRPMGAGRDLFGLRKAGDEIPVEIGLNPIDTPEGLFVLASIIDITERKRTEEKLAQHAAELARSNADLEQFAYVASHDMQEPIRMVVSYMQLLETRYKGKLDEKAVKYIEFSVDGAKRMQEMIKGLLNYSRVGKTSESYQPINTSSALETALKNLRQVIDDSKALITSDRLPTVMGDATQLVQVFQNLVSNAIKFRGEGTPSVQISVAPQEGYWRFSVRDNGIGIEPRSQYRIFQIFQRLHDREQYPGSGIGLAICKKIVERMGGKIWIESALGCGTTFYFTLPQPLSERNRSMMSP